MYFEISFEDLVFVEHSLVMTIVLSHFQAKIIRNRAQSMIFSEIVDLHLLSTGAKIFQA